MTNGTDLPGYRKASFCLPYNGGDIWIEHLDGIHTFSPLAVQKLTEDFITFRRPSMPSLLAVALDETVITEDLLEALADKLLYGGKRFTRVAFVGVHGMDKRYIKKSLAEASFAWSIINDFEKAKEWLISETYG